MRDAETFQSLRYFYDFFSVKHARVRLYSPISIDDSVSRYVFYVSVPPSVASANADVYITIYT